MILGLLADGKSVRAIAAELGFVYQTVWWQIKRAMQLRSAADKAELIAMVRAEMDAKTQAKALAS